MSKLLYKYLGNKRTLKSYEVSYSMYKVCEEYIFIHIGFVYPYDKVGTFSSIETGVYAI